MLEESFYASQKANYYNLSNILKEDYGVHGNIASNIWNETPSIVYYLHGKYYGVTKSNINNSKELEKELKDNNIDYYFLWNSAADLQLSGYHEITNGKISGLKIYSKN